MTEPKSIRVGKLTITPLTRMVGFDIGLPDSGAYIECFVRNGERIVRTSLFDNNAGRSIAWVKWAARGLWIAEKFIDGEDEPWKKLVSKK